MFFNECQRGINAENADACLSAKSAFSASNYLAGREGNAHKRERLPAAHAAISYNNPFTGTL